MTVVAAVEKNLALAHGASAIGEMAEREFDSKSLDDLGRHGLHPAHCRDFPKKVKQAFLKKLLPTDGHNELIKSALRCKQRSFRLRPDGTLATTATYREWYCSQEDLNLLVLPPGLLPRATKLLNDNGWTTIGCSQSSLPESHVGSDPNFFRSVTGRGRPRTHCQTTLVARSGSGTQDRALKQSKQ